MLEVRLGHSATLLRDGRVLVAGGSGSDGPLASAELCDPGSRTWTATGSMTEGRYNHSATLLPDGRVLVAGGGTSSSIHPGLDALASAELYDPSSGSWTLTAGMIEARYGHTAMLLRDGKVLVAGGDGGGDRLEPLASAELYDPGSGS